MFSIGCQCLASWLCSELTFLGFMVSPSPTHWSCFAGKPSSLAVRDYLSGQTGRIWHPKNTMALIIRVKKTLWRNKNGERTSNSVLTCFTFCLALLSYSCDITYCQFRQSCFRNASQRPNNYSLFVRKRHSFDWHLELKDCIRMIQTCCWQLRWMC